MSGPPTDERARLIARRRALEQRAAVRRAVRAHFEGEAFLEVETPTRVWNPGQELHLDAIAADDGRWLITSPEYHMKRLVGGGLPRIFQLGRAYRAAERGTEHQPEFTMLEWYRAEAPLEVVAQDCEALVVAAAEAAGVGREVPVPRRRCQTPGETVRLDPPFDRVTVRELFARHAGGELFGDESTADLLARARALGVDPGSHPAWDDVFFQIFLDRVEPHLGRGRPTFVFDWPLPLGALARRKAADPRVVERFELYAGGLELVNAFGELTDADEQRARFLAEGEQRRQRGKPVYPVDEPLLRALPHMPETSGAAMGFDRLVMLITGAEDIRDVVAFADDEA